MKITSLTAVTKFFYNAVHPFWFVALLFSFVLVTFQVSNVFAGININMDKVHSLKSDSDRELSWMLHRGDDIDPSEELRKLRNDGDISDNGYQKVTVPGNLALQMETPAKKDKAIVWYRLIFNITGLNDADLSQRKALAMRLGEISDRDQTYLNGKLIGSTGKFNSERPQAYDRLRVYELPFGLLQNGQNILHIRVQGYFEKELGIYRDRVEIGPASSIWQEYYLENASQVFALMVYATFALYFLLFYIRKSDKENLYFTLFLFCLVIYSLLHTQFKYVYGFELYGLKRIQTISVILILPLFYQFIRSFYPIKPDKLARIWDRIALVIHLIPLVGVGIVLISPSTALWQDTLDNLVQPAWLVYCIGILVILTRQIIKKNRNAILMTVTILVLMVTLVLDVLAGRAIINVPPLSTYAFILFVISMALILVNRYVSLQKETISLNKQLVQFNAASRRFVPFEFLDLLEKGSIVDVNLGDQVQKDMTVLFSDIRSFTSLSESMSPRENFDFINSYLRRMGPVIREYGGFIDKYIGDAIMALFANNADSAVKAAIAMHQSLIEWNEGRQKHNMVPVRIGVGIHIGRLMLGTIGENERMEGTVIADSVNLASRIEGLTKLYGAAVLLSGETLHALKSPESIQVRLVDRVKVKGKTSSVDLFELLDALDSKEKEKRIRSLSNFEQAMDFYKNGKLEEAEKLFRDIYMSDTDPAADVMVRRCLALKKSGLPQNWDGTTTLTMK